MYAAFIATCILINIIHVYCESSNTTNSTRAHPPANNADPNGNSLIERLQKQKQLILEQLVEAVQEGGRTVLRENNDSITSNDLHKIKELYGTLLKDDAFRKNVAEGTNMNGTDHEPGAIGSARRQKDMKLQLFDFVTLTSKRKKHKQAEKEQNRIIMQGRIDEWLLNRQLEKKKIKNYIDRVRIPKPEDCPRQGISRKKKRGKTRRNEDEQQPQEGGGKRRKKRRNSKYSGGKMYPCCRKCCKRSYMGCL